MIYYKVDAILSLVPGAKVSIDDGVVTWFDPPVAPVTDQQIDDELVRLNARAHIPASISMRQMRLSLLQNSLLNNVQALVDQAGNEAYQIEWEYANDVLRSAPLVALFGSELGLTEQQVDDVFILGATL